MTLSTTNNRVSYAGNGVTTAFSFPNKFLADADLVVISKDNTTLVETTLTLITDYTVSGATADAGGTVTLLVALASGKTLVIYRDPALTQDLDLVENDNFPPEEVEKRLDKAAMWAQRLKDLVSRAFRFSDGYAGAASTLLPDPSASKALRWNALASALENYEPGSAPDVALPGSNGLAVYTGGQNFTARTLTAGAGISVTNGDGQSGNPTVAVATAGIARPMLGASALLAPTVRRILSGSGTLNRMYAFRIATGSATVAATYTNNGITFTVYATVASSALVYMSGSAPPTASGVLTKASGSGDATLTFSDFAVPLSSRVKLAGGGGGGGGYASGSGANGTDSTYGTSLLTAPGGVGGAQGGTPTATASAPTINSPAMAVIATVGAGAGGVGFGSTTVTNAGSAGGANPLAGAGAAGGFQTSGVAGTANTGAGGGGAGTPGSGISAGGVTGNGGSSGAYLEAIIPNPSATYAYVIGPGGAGGTGASAINGGDGGSGIAIVEDRFQ